MSRRIGIFGGTFDPIHVGHLVTAVNARAALNLDVVELVVANEPWQKVGGRAVTPAADRLALVAAAVHDCEGIEVSDREIRRGGPSFTIDTVREILADEPGAQLALIVGADVIARLSSWRSVAALQALCELVVVNRPGSRLPEGAALAAALAGWRYEVIEVPALEVSSTDLRDRAATGRPLDFLIPEGAIRVIRERGLYALDR
jgi:nicotinate-nucleotide adenylyltransferase